MLIVFDVSFFFIQGTEEVTKARLNPTVWVIFGSLIIDLMGFTVILPLMPKLLDHYSATGGASIGFLQSTVQSLQQTFNIPANFNSVLTGGNTTFQLSGYLISVMSNILKIIIIFALFFQVSLVPCFLFYSSWLLPWQAACLIGLAENLL